MSSTNRSLTRRHFLQTGIAAGAWLGVASNRTFAASPNEEIRLGFIGCGGRGGQLIGHFKELDHVKIAGLYDPDPRRAAGAKNGSRTQATIFPSLPEMLENDDIDAVVIAACNHWHCLAAIQAMEAGKDVYVEKPLSHSQWEGQQVVAAARKYNRICQVGTQQRSDPMQAEIKKFLHEEKALGEILGGGVASEKGRHRADREQKPKVGVNTQV